MFLPAFLKKWLDPRLSKPVGIQPVKFVGWSQYMQEVRKKAQLHLSGPKQSEVIAIIGLLDLSGPDFFPPNAVTIADRHSAGKKYVEKRVVKLGRFHQFFAIHEVEAWLLSSPELFPQFRSEIEAIANPEEVNDAQPPSKFLSGRYQAKLKRRYEKVTDGG